jgi:uncharacterized metal-binding protein YceD (DUF177 family)
MNTLGLEFRFDLLGFTPRAFEGALSIEQVQAAVGGLIGDLGYRVDTPARAEGTVVRTAGGEVVVNSRFTAELGFDCVRCLTARTVSVDLTGQHVLIKQTPSAASDGDEAIELDQDALDAPEEYGFDGETVKLADVFREELVLAVSMNPQCSDAGAEECAAALPEQAPEAQIDPRWAPLLALKQRMQDGE